MAVPLNDPFTVTMGRTEIWLPQRWLAPIREHETEIAAAMSVMFAGVAALMILYGLDSGDRERSNLWAYQPWVKKSCVVKGAGIAYRGTCGLDLTLQMTHYDRFSECVGPTTNSPKAQSLWGGSEAGKCAKKGDEAFKSIKRREKEEEKEMNKRDAGDQMDLDERRLQIAPPHHHPRCHNGYLAWARVLVPKAGGSAASAPGAKGGEERDGGEARCAYQFGAPLPSSTSDWAAAAALLERLQDSLQLPLGVPCWTLAADDCVVSLDDARRLVKKDVVAESACRVVFAIFVILALALGGLAARWHCQDHGCCGVIPPSGYHCSLPTREPDEDADWRQDAAPLSDRVRSIVSVAAARLGDATPPSSMTPGRVGNRRTIEVIGPTGERTTIQRNVATDFLPAHGERADGSQRCHVQ